MAKNKDKQPRVQINNKRATFDYELLEQYDAGIVLVGTEIKSIRAGKASLQDAYCYFSGGELYVRGMNVATYFWASAWSSGGTIFSCRPRSTMKSNRSSTVLS